MLFSGISADQAPPLHVPLRFFLSAPLFGLLAALSLFLWGDIFFTTRFSFFAFGITHLFTLGFAAMVMLGALFQMMPVLAGVRYLYPVVFAGVVHVFLLAGTLLLSLAFLLGYEGLLSPAVFFLSGSVLVFAAGFFLSLRQKKVSNPTVGSMRFALLALLLALLLGASLALMRAWSIDSALHQTLQEIHMGWALGGWVFLLFSGVSLQVLPMFFVTTEFPVWLKKWFSPVFFLLLLLWSASKLLAESQGNSLFWLGEQASRLFLTMAVIFFSLISVRLVQTRRRKLPDTTVANWLLASASLSLAALLWYLRPWLGQLADYGEIYDLLLGLLLLAGFLLPIITGMLYKIVPFLVWFHLNGLAMQKPQIQIPNMKEVMPDKGKKRQFALQVLAIVFLLLATVTEGLLYLPAAAFLLGSFFLLLVNLLRATLVYRRFMQLIGQGEN